MVTDASRTGQEILCQCGRPLNRVHCSYCGCATVYGLSSRSERRTRSDGTSVTLRVFRCRKCTAVFNDDDWQLHCNAPAQRLGRPIDASRTETPTISATDALSALDVLQKKYGIGGDDK